MGGNLFFFAATPVGALIGTALASPLTRWFDKKPSVIIGTLCWALCQVIPVVLRLLGWFPENGTSELLYSLIVIKFIQGLGVVQALIAFNSMVADNDRGFFVEPARLGSIMISMRNTIHTQITNPLKRTKVVLVIQIQVS